MTYSTVRGSLKKSILNSLENDKSHVQYFTFNANILVASTWAPRRGLHKSLNLRRATLVLAISSQTGTLQRRLKPRVQVVLKLSQQLFLSTLANPPNPYQNSTHRYNHLCARPSPNLRSGPSFRPRPCTWSEVPTSSKIFWKRRWVEQSRPLSATA